MPRIFISYRREDSEAITGRIYDRLVVEFSSESVFLDVYAIKSGLDFREVLQNAVNQCDVLLAIIGPRWLSIEENGIKRLDNPDDFVRLEIKTGLERKETLIVPTLVGGAHMPMAYDLPQDIEQLAYRNAHIIQGNPNFHRDIDRLIDRLKEHFQNLETAKKSQPRRYNRLFAIGVVIMAAVATGIILFSNNTLQLLPPNSGTLAVLAVTDTSATAVYEETQNAIASQVIVEQTAVQATNDALSTQNAPTNTLTPTPTSPPSPTLIPTPIFTETPNVAATETAQANSGSSDVVIEQTVVQATLNTQPTTLQETGRIPITVANVDELELGYALRGWCGSFSSDGRLLTQFLGVYDVSSGEKLFSGYAPVVSHDGSLVGISGDGIYEVSSGIKLFAIGGNLYNPPEFSPDGNWVAVGGEGVYEISSGMRLFSISDSPTFSSDGSLVAVSRDGVYEVSSRTKLFAIAGDSVVFSPDGNLVAVSGDGVYEVNSKTKRFTISGSRAAFSPDGGLVAVNGDGVYEVSSRTKLFAIAGGFSTYFPKFSPDGNWVAVGSDGVYEVSSRTKIFSGTAIFSPDGGLVAVNGDGVYEVSSKTKLFSLSNSEYPVTFSPDGSFLVVPEEGIYKLLPTEKLIPIHGSQVNFSPEGTLLSISSDNSLFCALFGIKGVLWPYRSGLVAVRDSVNVRFRPNFEASIVSGAYLERNDQLRVIARTLDNRWYKIGEDQWVSALVVDVIYMPEEIPIEDS